MAKQPVRRLVTGRDDDGEGVVLFDGPAPSSLYHGCATIRALALSSNTQTGSFYLPFD